MSTNPKDWNGSRPTSVQRCRASCSPGSSFSSSAEKRIPQSGMSNCLGTIVCSRPRTFPTKRREPISEHWSRNFSSAEIYRLLRRTKSPAPIQSAFTLCERFRFRGFEFRVLSLELNPKPETRDLKLITFQRSARAALTNPLWSNSLTSLLSANSSGFAPLALGFCFSRP